MKILNKNLKKGIIKVAVENLDDLWYLSHLIDKQDLVRSSTVRKIKIGDDEKKQRIVTKKITLTIKTEKVEFKDNILRISGTIEQGTEEIPKGRYHTINVEENTVLTITKERWLSFQLEKLEESAKIDSSNILICALDREEAIFALSKRKGYEILSELKGEVQKKDERTIAKGSFYEQIIKILEEYKKRHNIEKIIIASPAFWKEEFMKKVKDDELKKIIILASCSSIDKGAINEILRRDEIKQALRQDKTSKELILVEEILGEISKDGPVVYGIKEVKEASDAGAIKKLAVTDQLIKEKREKEEYEEIDNILKATDSLKGQISIISSENDPGKKLDGIGGIAALLRYKLNY